MPILRFIFNYNKTKKIAKTKMKLFVIELLNPSIKM